MTQDLGLTTGEVDARLAAGGGNVAPPGTGRTLGEILRANVVTRFNAILGALFVVVVVVGPAQDALFGAVLVANTGIGVVQELRAKRTLERLRILSAPRAHVLRCTSLGSPATEAELALSEVVADDVLVLRAGDQVPVDGVVVSGDELEMDESLLSGESEPARRRCGDAVLSGSVVVAGSGLIRATAVGADAYAAGLEAQARRFSLVRSELQAGTNTVLRLVTWVMVPAGAGLVASQLLRSHQSLGDALRGSVAGVSAMVPEGLVLLTSVAFAVGALRLARRRVLVQELAALEGLARVDMLCIDKTGTLTEAGMHLVAVTAVPGWRDQDVLEAAGAVSWADPAPNATLAAIRSSQGAPAGWDVVDRVAFSSARKWSAVHFADKGTWVLGAPEVLPDGPPQSLRSQLDAQRADGRRVLVLGRARRHGPAATLEVAGLGDVEPVALLVLAEHLRAETAETVRYLVDEGVALRVLSGDAPATVASVAALAGVPALGAPLDASTLGTDTAAWAEALARSSVVGRIRPEQKVAAVRALQQEGHVVAMVGDGVNDVPALKQADLGIAMGAGSQSSRSVARIVLLDSRFAGVPHILAEARRVIANIERVANLFVTKTVYAAALAVLVASFGIPFPFFPRHLTVVSTLTIGVPGFFLALAAGAPRAAPRFVRRVLRFTVPSGLVVAAATMTVYGAARAMPATTIAQARTAAMLVLLGLSLLVLAEVARPLRPARVLLLTAMAAGVPLLLAFDFARRVLALALPGPAMLVVALGVWAAAAVLLAVVWRRAGAVPRRPGRHESRAFAGPSSIGTAAATKMRPPAAAARESEGALHHG